MTNTKAEIEIKTVQDINKKTTLLYIYGEPENNAENLTENENTIYDADIIYYF